MFRKFPKPQELSMLDLPSHEEAMAKAAIHGQLTLISSYAVPSPYGKFGVSTSAFGVSMVFFPGFDDDEFEERMYRYRALGYSDMGDRRAIEAGIELMGYLVGDVREFETPVDVSFSTPFAQCIYRELTRVPFGETITYGELARRAGHPSKARAVGTVLRHNPCPIFVPCHRVVSASGKLGGWSGPEGWKEELLAIEGLIDRPAAGAN